MKKSPFSEEQIIVEELRIDDNQHQPHTGLRGLTPNEFATRSRSDHKKNRAQF